VQGLSYLSGAAKFSDRLERDTASLGNRNSEFSRQSSGLTVEGRNVQIFSWTLRKNETKPLRCLEKPETGCQMAVRHIPEEWISVLRHLALQ